MNFDDILFRCSGLKGLMSEGRGKNELWGETSKDTMRSAWILYRENRFKEMSNKFVVKGIKGEAEALKQYSLHRYMFLKKNDVRLSNKYITGEIDTFIGNSVTDCEETIDIKCSWDVHSFYKSVDSPLNPVYELQGLGYLALSGGKKHTIAYILLNTELPEIKHVFYQEGFKYDGNEIPIWIQLQMLSNMVYDRATFDAYIKELGCFPVDENSEAVYAGFFEKPMSERIHEKTIYRDDAKIQEIYNRVIAAREYMRNDPTFLN